MDPQRGTRPDWLQRDSLRPMGLTIKRLASIENMNFIRVIPSLVTSLNWIVNQLEVKNAFLHGNLEEEVYMNALSGFGNSFTQGKVYRIKKKIVCFEAISQSKVEQFSRAMQGYGYRQAQSDQIGFMKYSSYCKQA